MLYRPELHEPLTDAPWDERHVREAIRAIVADAEAAYAPDGLWPAHEWDGWRSALPLKNLYVGAAGVVWALDALRPHAETTLDLGDIAGRALESFRADPDFMTGEELPVPPESALLAGESGLLTVAWRQTPSGPLAEALLARVRENRDNDASGVMWGSPGTLIAARAMLEWTGDERWREAWDESADALLTRREPDGLWTQRLYGESRRSLGPPHGLVGIVASLRPLLDPTRLDPLLRETAGALARTAVVEHGRANWLGSDGEPRLQWCGGAPGIVVTAAGYLDEELLLAAAELVWDAGPLGDEKGAGICHGTAGNGYAFLKTFERTGDERWLERARAFAMHALEQSRRLPGRYSLFTGGVGAALFASDCLDARARFPVLDGL